jgi:hypothetical protein
MIANQQYILCEDWGWYIDIENMKPIYEKNYHYNVKNRKMNKLETIIENDYYYEYYDDLQNNVNKNKNNTNNIIIIYKNNYIFDNLFNFSSSTIITAILTYFIFFMK